jgi:hypothetical protein
MIRTVREALESVYREAIFEVDFEGGREQFVVGTTGSLRPPFFGITAYNAGFERPTLEENEAANRELVRMITELGVPFWPAVGRDRESTHVEPSFAVFGISEETAIALARRFRQAAVVHWDGERARMLWCD